MCALKQYEVQSFAPGRVNLLGEHLDYNGGPVLPFTIDRYVKVRALPNAGDIITLTAADFNQQVSVRLSDLESKLTLDGDPLPGWAAYPAGVAWALQQHGFPVQGIEAAFDSSIPIGAGLSSSAAVEMAFAVLWQELGGWSADRMTLAKICLRAEVDYIGLNCGLMDQFAVSHGEKDHVLFFDTCSLLWEVIPFPDIALVIVDSTISHKLADSAYNDRQAECQQALKQLQVKLPGIKTLRDVCPQEFERVKDILPGKLQKRVRHVIEECGRVFAAVDCLRAGDIDGLGRLMVEGHASLRDLYEVSCKQLDSLVDKAIRIPGCRGARMTGAGFGGSTINLVDWHAVDDFLAMLKKHYLSEFGLNARAFTTRPVGSAWAERAVR